MLEYIILGTIQGIAEWLPVSSEGLIVLIVKNFRDVNIYMAVRTALFLHLGTFLAALVYFRKDVLNVIKIKDKKLFNFLLISTLISGIIGFILLKAFVDLEKQLLLSSEMINLIIGLLLLITAYLQLKVKRQGNREIKDLDKKDGLILGLVQGFSTLPGLSRSGLTVSSLLIRKFNSQDSLKLSFLMSLPVVLGGNIILNFKEFVFSFELLIGLISSFVFGLLTIDLLLKLARKINFGYFVLIFGFLIIISTFV